VASSFSGKRHTLGTGFFITSNIIVTNHHVVRDATRISAKMVASGKLLAVKRVINADAKRDLALLEVYDADAPSLELGGSSSLALGQEILVIGNPEGLEGTLSMGIISGFREFGGQQFIQISAPISPGSSGGPVIDSSGKVIGVTVAALREGQNLNFAIPSDDVRALFDASFSASLSFAPAETPADCEKDFKTRLESAESYRVL